MTKSEIRDVHIGVMVTPSTKARLDELARCRERPFVSSTANDILELFFAIYGSDVTRFEDMLSTYVESQPKPNGE